MSKGGEQGCEHKGGQEAAAAQGTNQEIMGKKKQRQVADKLSASLMRRLRRSRALNAKELHELVAKDQRLCDAMQERTTSGALRRAIHVSKILLPDLAARAQADMDTLDAFLTGDRPLTSDVIDRLATMLKLKLEGKLAKASESIE